MAFKWLSGTRRSMQRLGFCKAVLMFSDRARTSGEMVDLLRTELGYRNLGKERLRAIPDYQGVCDWRKARPNAGSLGQSEDGTNLIHIQDIYIFRHSSKSGWLSRLGFNEYVEYLPRRLKFVDSIYEPTNMGEVLSKGLMNDMEKKSFEIISDKVNPLSLTMQQQIYFLYNLLIADGDFFIPFMSSLLSNFGENSFSYLNVGKTLPTVIEKVASHFSASLYTSDDRKQYDRLIELKRRVKKQNENGVEREGSGSSREQTNVPRLEWMADLGLVKRVKSDKSASRLTYGLTEIGRTFARKISQEYDQALESSYPEESLQKVMDNSFYSTVNLSYFNSKAEFFSGNDVFSFLQEGYELVKDVYGYCLCRPLLLLSNTLTLKELNSSFLEYNHAIELIEAAYQRNPSRFHYAIDRSSTDYQIKFERE